LTYPAIGEDFVQSILYVSRIMEYPSCWNHILSW